MHHKEPNHRSPLRAESKTSVFTSSSWIIQGIFRLDGVLWGYGPGSCSPSAQAAGKGAVQPASATTSARLISKRCPRAGADRQLWRNVSLS